MTSRPTVAVFDVSDSNKVSKVIPLPGVFTAPLRVDIVQFVFANLNKNRRQAHSVNHKAGMKHSAESWGTGRAVARIPRVSGSGTNRSGQGAFGNQCRKGRMAHPLKTWRRWHRAVNVIQKRHAVAAALAASAVVPLVLARGHRISNIPELPLVVDNSLESVEKTKNAIKFLKSFHALEDVKKVIESKKIRAGQGKLRNNRYILKKGPLVVYSNENVKLVKAFRNIPGVETCNVNRLNLLQLAPGGQVGRFIIWTEDAFKRLNYLFGSNTVGSQGKQGYHLQKSVLTNPDISKIINSNEVQSKLKPAARTTILHEIQKKNPLKNFHARVRLNPNALLVKQTARHQNKHNHDEKQKALKEKRALLTQDQKKAKNLRKSASRKWFTQVTKNVNDSSQV